MLDVELSVALVMPDRMLAEDLAGLDDRALLGLVGTLPIASGRRYARCS